MKRSEILIKLAETMDVNALLQQHPELDEQDVRDSLQIGGDLLYEKDNPLLAGITKLYRAYNGTMAGLFVGAYLYFSYVVKDQKRLKHIGKNITDFIITFNHQFKGRLNLSREYDNLEEAVEQELREYDDTIAKYYLLGSAVFRSVLLRKDSSEKKKASREAKRLLSELGHPPLIFEKSTEKIGKTYIKREPTWQDMMSACIRFLRELIYTVDEEKETCFVALPFKKTYLKRYLDFYRLIANKMQKLAFRAWGGLGFEEHQEMLLLLVAKSGAILADVTEPNANVTMELGFALGQNKKVWLIAEADTWKRISNVKMDWVYQYNLSDDKYWFVDQAERAWLYFAALESGRRPGPVPVWDIDPIESLYMVDKIFEKAIKEKKKSD